MFADSMEYYNIADLFTTDEINRAMILFIECKNTKEDFNARCANEMVWPIISRVNAHAGYNNIAEYWVYCLEHYLRSVRGEEGVTRH
jgi:hypothetical protein